MASITGTLYIGITNDIGARVRQHKALQIEGFSKRHKCTRLVYYESYQWVQDAIAREKQLKRWRREKKIMLIEMKNPRWQDLAESWGREFVVRGQSTKEADEQIAKRVKLQVS